MPSPTVPAAQFDKQKMREQAHENRKNQADKETVSQTICAKFMALPEYANAQTVMFYVDVRTEVRTRDSFGPALASGKKIVVPYCVDGELELFWLQSMEDLAVGMYKILEPREELRSVPERKVSVKELDLIMVPGVAFDRNGSRMGHGKGYYDKLLEHARPGTPLVALAFDCQIFADIPMQSHDVSMDKVITESAIFEGRGRKQV